MAVTRAVDGVPPSEGEATLTAIFHFDMVWRASGVILGFPLLSGCFFSRTVVFVFVGHPDELA